MTAGSPTVSAGSPAPSRGAAPSLTAALDRLLGRVTMYRLVLLSLAALAVIATTLAALGQVGALTTPGTSPTLLGPALLASLAVLLVWSYLSNRLLAALFRVRPHSESSLITALLLFFILSPSLDPLGLMGLAVVAVLANATKYLIAVRGRHVVNPAAAGALIGYSVGLVSTPWWVGQLWLLPFTVVLGAVVVWRTRRFALVGVFLLLAVAARTVDFALDGGSVADGLAFSFQYSPLVFLACFMLTEPLTIPPRRWQQLLVAAVVALVLIAPISLDGPTFGIFHLQLTVAPELALVVGNIVAFLFGQRRGIRLRLRARRQLTPTSWEFDFEPERPVRFAAGQYLELTVPHRGADSRGTRRTFSIASAPGTADTAVRLGLWVPAERSSSFKRALLELEPGTAVAATAVGGDFLLPADRSRPLLLVAGGIGITPFVAQLEHDGSGRDTVLVYAVSSTDEIAYAVELARSGARVLLVSPEPLPRMPEHWSWLGAGPLTADLLLGAVPDAAGRAAYLSGPPALIAALRPALRRAGARRIRTDAFLGY